MAERSVFIGNIGTSSASELRNFFEDAGVTVSSIDIKVCLDSIAFGYDYKNPFSS